MKRSSTSERTQRINAALTLINKYKSFSRANKALAEKYGISKRQAYRYIQEAMKVGKQIPVPDTKIAFTVKLSRKLVKELRQYAKSKGQRLSDVVTHALEALLHKDR